MNLLFVIPRFHTNLYYALKALSETGHRVDLVCADWRNGAEGIASTHTAIDQATLSYREGAALMKRLAPDLVVIRKSGRLSKIMHRVAMQQRRKVIGYDQRPWLRPRHVGQVIHGVLNGRPMRRFTPVHGLAGSGRPDPRAVYLPFPVEAMPEDATRDYALGGEIRILCVGKLAQKRKNHFLLLRALEPLAAHMKFRITFVGSSSTDIRDPDHETYTALKRYALEGQIAERVTIKPDMPFSDMTAIYRTHDICVLPSQR